MAVIRGTFQQLYDPSFRKLMMEEYKNPKPPPDIMEQWEMWLSDPTDETFSEWRERKNYG